MDLNQATILVTTSIYNSPVTCFFLYHRKMNNIITRSSNQKLTLVARKLARILSLMLEKCLNADSLDRIYTLIVNTNTFMRK